MSKELDKPQPNNTLPQIDKKGKDVFPSKIEFPKEIQLLEELNKIREEEYKKWRHKKELADKLLGRATLIIGVRGKDGIILGGDTKVIRGGEIDDYVGGEPQIVYIIDEKAKIEEVKYNRDLIKEKVDKVKELLKNISFTSETGPITGQSKDLLK